MSSTIILNSTNRSSTNSSRYEYLFPSTVKFPKGSKIALQSFSMYNSIFNIEAQRGNNQVKIIWNADSAVEYTCTFSDGFYSISDLNFALQQFCILNDLYMIDGDGNFVYFVEILTNSVLYSSEIDCTAIPTTAEATTLGYTIPSGASWSHPVTAKTAQLEIISTAFASLLGMSVATYPPTILAIDSQHLSTTEPQISPVNSILLGCNLVSSRYSNPSHLFYSIPLTVGFGSMITHNSSSVILNNISPGSYGKISIDLYSQDFNSLRIHDSEIVLVLQIILPDE